MWEGPSNKTNRQEHQANRTILWTIEHGWHTRTRSHSWRRALSPRRRIGTRRRNARARIAGRRRSLSVAPTSSLTGGEAAWRRTDGQKDEWNSLFYYKFNAFLHNSKQTMMRWPFLAEGILTADKKPVPSPKFLGMLSHMNRQTNW